MEGGPSIDRPGSYLAPHLLVVHTAGGFVLPVHGRDGWVRPGQPPWAEPLDAPALALVARLASTGIAAGAGLDADGRLATLLGRLRAEDLLVTAEPRPSGVPRPSGGSNPPSSPVPPTAGTRWLAPTPQTYRPGPDGFEAYDTDGRLIAVLSVDELLLLDHFTTPDVAPVGKEPLVARLADAGLLHEADSGAIAKLLTGTTDQFTRMDEHYFHRFVEQANRRRRHRLAERRTLESEPDTRPLVPVFPVVWPAGKPNLALGMIFAFARAFEGGRLRQTYDLDPYFLVRVSALRKLLAQGPAVFLHSNYVWSHDQNLAVSAAVKAHSPASLNVHGGPNTPKYRDDVVQFFADHPHVDVCIHGEGEATTAALLAALDGTLNDLSPLAEVPGLSFRSATGEIVRTADRDRIIELDQIPSPFLTGLMDVYSQAASYVTIETNRGCPYGCTFCDWGSATQSRIRKFSLDRVRAEIDWAGRHQIPELWVADANFGIWERDVEIAEMVAETARRYGYPRAFRVNYAKNTMKHLARIIEVLVDAGLVCEAVMALQTNDVETLDAVHRTNIKTTAYDELAATFAQKKLPCSTELIYGLPGSTPQGFSRDLQRCIDHEMGAHAHPAVLLVNSPMNEPGYKRAFQIEAERVYEPHSNAPLDIVFSTSTFTRSDHALMQRRRNLFVTTESFGVLRHVSRWVRHETGQPEMMFYERLDETIHDEPDRYPMLRWGMLHVVSFGVPPLAWRRLLDEVPPFLHEQLGIDPGAALETVLAVQDAVLPARGRQYPFVTSLDHDYPAWFQAHLDAKLAGADWVAVVPPLATFGPSVLTVDDPNGLATAASGQTLDIGQSPGWELESPVSRFLPSRHVMV